MLAKTARCTRSVVSGSPGMTRRRSNHRSRSSILIITCGSATKSRTSFPNSSRTWNRATGSSDPCSSSVTPASCRTGLSISGRWARPPLWPASPRRPAALGREGPGLCAGIVGHADLLLGDPVRKVLEAHSEAGRGRFKGIRQIAVWHPDPNVKGTLSKPQPHLMVAPSFRAGFAASRRTPLLFRRLGCFTRNSTSSSIWPAASRRPPSS